MQFWSVVKIIFWHIILTLYRQYDQYVKLTSWSVDLHEHEELMTFTALIYVEKWQKKKKKYWDNFCFP